MSGPGDGDLVRAVIADDGLAHVDAVRAGLTALARAAQFAAAELRDLVRREGITEHAEVRTRCRRRCRGGRHGPSRSATRGHGQILAAGHARIVFSVIPTLPPEAVTWPRAIAPTPTSRRPAARPSCSSGSTSSRRVLWRVAEGRPRRDEPMRRALAFYETGSRLSLRGGFSAA